MGNIHNLLLKSQPPDRLKSIKFLVASLKNPGRFSILLLGEAGTGKSFWTQLLHKVQQAKEGSTAKLIAVNSHLAEPSFEFWESKLKDAEKGILLVENIESIGENQHYLFEALSTENGKFGFTEKKYEVVPVFTSKVDVSSLRKSDKGLSSAFFDRISQLVVSFPPLYETPNSTQEDFINVWKGMEFKENNQVPGEDSFKWIRKNVKNLHGNFRDLQKIAIQWHHYRFMGMVEDKISELVFDSFSEKSSFPEENTKLEDGFFFQSGKTYDDLLRGFRKEVKKWAKNEHGDLKTAAQKLDISPRTFDRW